MLTQLKIRNFKTFREASIELGETVVFVGPNNSGKTSALQALALWELGLRSWAERRSGGKAPERRPGVTLNRKDLVTLPVPDPSLLWYRRRVVKSQTVGGRTLTPKVRMDIVIEGVSRGKSWQCGLEFDYANEEAIYCRPLRLDDSKTPGRMPIPEEAHDVRLAFLPPMSGLTANELRIDAGAINVRIGEGRTAEVLRNLCLGIYESSEGPERWEGLAEKMKQLFGVELDPPEYITSRGEISMSYRDKRGVRLDLASAGRGLQQTLLLLAYLFQHRGAVLLLDEPDAHLEILRQRQIYGMLTEVARAQGSQIIAASHSEIVLNEAADRDVVVAFVGKPHRIDDRGNQLLKSLKSIGFEHYYQAEQTGWVLYLEGSTDLAILRSWAKTLRHPAERVLDRVFAHWVGNQPNLAREHFQGLREAKKDLQGFALYDRLPRELHDSGPTLKQYVWLRREIENYLCFPEVLEAYARSASKESAPGPLFLVAEEERRLEAMRQCISDLVPPVALRNLGDPWWRDTKASDAFLDRLFVSFFERLRLPNLMRKTDYHELAGLVPAKLIDPEIRTVLDQIVEVAQRATPLRDDENDDEN